MRTTRETQPARNLSSQNTFGTFSSKQSETVGSPEVGSYTPAARGVWIVRFQRPASKTDNI
ncbi:MAG: hypothetical protein ACI8P0_006791, partial [Planctomycetaceae bacterium]